MGTEVEARFRVTKPAGMGRLVAAAGLGPATLGPPHEFDEVDRYLDTTDGALARAGWACRLRGRGGEYTLSLKGPPEAGSGGWLHRRPEVEGPAGDGTDPSAWPPSPAREKLDRLRSGGALTEVVALHQHRVERAVTVDLRPVATLSLDDVVAAHDGTVLGRYGVVEVELGPADPAAEEALVAVAAALAALPDLAVEPRTKLERALELARREL